MLDIPALILSCAPNVAPATMQAIIKVESRGNPNAIGLNKGYKLKTQPKNSDQAKQWADYLEKNNYNFDVGLAQLNIRNIKRFGYKASDVLDPCLNVKLSARILTANYKSAKQGNISSDAALKKAISAYNTGNFSSGFSNGYVGKVYAAANIKNVDLTNIPPIVSNSSTTQINQVAKSSSKANIQPHHNSKSTNSIDDPNSSSILLYKRSKNAAKSFY